MMISHPAFHYELEREREDLARASAIDDPIARMVERERISAMIRAQAMHEIEQMKQLADQNAEGRRPNLAPIRTRAASISVRAPMVDAESGRPRLTVIRGGVR